MRRMMTREVTKTTVTSAKMDLVDGMPVAVPLPDQVFVGNVKMDKAQKEMNKLYDHPVTVLKVVAETETYEMPVEEFIKLATIKEPVSEEE